MKTFSSVKTLILVAFLSLFFLSGSFAQDKKNDGCCANKTMEKMDHSKSNHSMTNCKENKDSVETSKDSIQTSEFKAIEVDSKLEAWNEVCPVRGDKIDPEANKVSYNDKIYGFCCNGCDAKFLKDPDKFSKNLSEDGKSFLGTR